MNRKYLIYTLPLLIILILLFVFFPRQKSVSFAMGGDIQAFETNSRNVEAFISEIGISLHPEDQIIPELETAIKDGDLIEITKATTYLITIDGEPSQIITSENDPISIFEKAGVKLSSNDMLLVNGNLQSIDIAFEKNAIIEIELIRPISLTINSETGATTIQTTALTVGEALWEANILLMQNEKTSIPLDTKIRKSTTISIVPANIFEIKIGDQKQQIQAIGGTVGVILAQAGISLQNLDYSIPAEDQVPPEDGLIEVVRVAEVILSEQELIPFSSLTQPMPDVEIDNYQILQVGEYGLNSQRIRVRFENGQEVLRTVEDEWQVREPVPRIEGYGTLIDLKTLETPDGVIEYWRAKEFYITSYKAGTPETPPWYGRVFCYSQLFEPGFVGVDFDYIPCGTKLYIPGYGFAVAMDTGAISGAWIDLGFRDEEYFGWHRFETVYFLSPPPAPENIPYIIPPGQFYE